MVYLGETIRYTCKFYDFKSQAVQPTSHDIKVTDSDGTQIHSDTSPTYDAAEGYYYTDFTIPADGDVGNYKLVWKATYGSNTWVTKRLFAVENV